MEVHHHPHVPHHTKPWKEYIIEGIMIFVAVTLGYGAENIREHFVEKNKAIVNVQNLYKDLKDDSINFVIQIKIRNKQDSCTNIISNLYDQRKIEQSIPTLYAAHSYIAYRIMPVINTMALDQIKSSGAINFIEDERLKQEIQYYANSAIGLKTRELREYNFIDKNLDPLTMSRFEHKFFQEISEYDNFEIKGDEILVTIKIPEGLKIINKSTFDWDNYLSVLSMLKTIRKSTDRLYTLPIQTQCNKLLGHVRNYLIENNALIE